MKTRINSQVKVLSSDLILRDPLRLFAEKKATFWEEEGKKKNFKIFKEASVRVPAYKNFLKIHRVDSAKIKNWDDIVAHVPQTDKANYLRKYPLKDLCWDGRLDKQALVFAATSGTTGNPFYFPRDEAIDWQSSVLHELFLSHGDHILKSTLVIICFGMGVWIGGIITYQAFKKLGERGRKLSIITPGINKEEIFNAVKNLGPLYQQIILCGYPPFIKDIIDEGEMQGIRWKQIPELKIVFAAETFSEKFRDYIVRKTDIKNLFTDTMNIYGTADLGTMAEETTASIALRRAATKSKKFHQALFPDAGKRLPTLVQFNPLFTNFEEKDGSILITAYNYLPLIRYAIGDRGGVISYNEVMKKAALVGLSPHTIRVVTKSVLIPEFPFVYLYERMDLSTKLYGAIIYSEHIREALQGQEFEDFLTGKFSMLTKFDQNQNQYLAINIELKPQASASEMLKIKVLGAVIQYLIDKNAEYRNNYLSMQQRVVPHLNFLPYGDPEYFKSGSKQKWVKKP